MKINLSPQASGTRTEISVSGEKLTYDGTEYDFSLIPDGGEVEAEFPAIGTIRRVNGEIEITLLYQYDPLDCTDADRFPAPVNVTEGIVIPTEVLDVQN